MTGGSRPQAANADLARRVIGTEPLRADLPPRPSVSADSNANRSARPAVASPVESRQTGAAARQPGVALDNELRRSRIFNGRVQVSTPAGNNTGQTTDTRPTGAVTRPDRPSSPLINREPVNPAESSGNDRPVRSSRPREDRPVNVNPADAPSRRDRNPEAGQTEQPSAPVAAPQPAEPRRTEPPARSEPPARARNHPRDRNHRSI